MSTTSYNSTDYLRFVEENTYQPQTQAVEKLITQANLTATQRVEISTHAADLVGQIRTQATPGLIEVFLAEYGLSTDEGIALMCLAEALLRVPDADTIDALIEDKVASSDWGRHLGHSTSPMVNVSTWALMLTGKVLQETAPGVVGTLHNVLRRLGEPVVRVAVAQAMKEMGRQFILGENITQAMERAQTLEQQGYSYSYDMLGEAACTEADANHYYLAYSRAITAIADACVHEHVRDNPGISIKLSALHPRYEEAQKARVMQELVPRVRALALLAKSANMGLTIDAEEAGRLALSLDIIAAVLADPALAGWDGFGIVVQAYSKRATDVLDWFYCLSRERQRKTMVRLVKGAYWDTEIKRAQVAGLADYPVFTHKSATDISYIANARKLLQMTDTIYPQFATHNAHTISAVLAGAPADKTLFEFQRLHGMGEALHEIIRYEQNTRCRIYAPVGAHRDLLAYLVRRLLENGANSSFVNQLVNSSVSPQQVAADPFAEKEKKQNNLISGADLFQPQRANAQGFDIDDRPTLQAIEQARTPYQQQQWRAAPLLASGKVIGEKTNNIFNPATPDSVVGEVLWASAADVENALNNATTWQVSAQERATILNNAVHLIEKNYGQIFALLAREAGKTIPDAIAELREGVDFLRYYAAGICAQAPLGIVACISPWNFPLAIFIGQISAALAAGNAVIAKPAEQTPLIAHYIISLLHQAGVPIAALQLLLGAGDIGKRLISDSRINGVVFTGATETAHNIRQNMADNTPPGTPLIAETGGLNAMLIDSTALPEQAIAAVIESAFQSAGQRCSALRCLYVQEDIAEHFLKMLIGAMQQLQLGNPWHLHTDIGPVIDKEAKQNINTYIELARNEGRVLHECSVPTNGTFVAPTLITINSIADLQREIFGPVLHVVTFSATQIDDVITAINSSGYGLTFGLQTRIDDRVQYITERIHVGNIYVNRNQIGAVVGSQPFGGEGLSGTGPKAGGPLYLSRFSQNPQATVADQWQAPSAATHLQQKIDEVAAAVAERKVDTIIMPGPTGESNQLTFTPRPPILCAGPGEQVAKQQAQAIEKLGGIAVCADGQITAEQLITLSGISGVIWWGEAEEARHYEQALAKRAGAIVPLITGQPDKAHACSERHVCVDTTATGGNAALLSGETA